jgi:hypothetical protein
LKIIFKKIKDMFKKIVFIISFILISFLGTAQKDINNYKYIIVPKTFNLSDGDDQYQLNSLTKFLFNKYGYEAYFVDDDFPADLKNNRCLSLTAVLSKENNSMFKTKLEFILKDCFGVVVMKSKLGESRLKKYDRAYNEALRKAFETFQNLDYKYSPNQKKLTQTSLSESITLKNGEAKSFDNAGLEEVKVAVNTEQTVVLGASEIVKTNVKTTEINSSELYYAQEIENGYQIVNSEPRIVMILLLTALKNVFIIKDKSAIVFKEDGFWYYSENNGKLGEKQSLKIKF